MNDRKYIIKVKSRSVLEPVYIQKIGNYPQDITFTSDIYKARIFNSGTTAKKYAARAENYVEKAYKMGWTCYDYEHLDTKVLAVRMIVLN